MHPVLVDNIDDFADKAAGLADNDMSKQSTNDFILSGYRLYRNFAVLLAAGYIDFADETARAILTRQTLESKEAIPEFFKGIADSLTTVDIDDLSPDFDFAEHMLVYEDGCAVLQKFAFPDGGEGDEEEDEADAQCCGSVSCSNAEMQNSEASPLENVQSRLNAESLATWGELTDENATYNELKAKVLCGLPLVPDEQGAFLLLHELFAEADATRLETAKEFAAVMARDFGR
jgi:hypothetical protein